MVTPARSRWILAIVLMVGIAVTWWVRRRPPQYTVAYVGDRSTTVWSTTAQVRQTVTTLDYGDKVTILRQAGDQAQIRTASGAQGWMDAHLLVSPEMWRKLSDMVIGTRSMPVQAVGHTRALANVHVEPNRDSARTFQFGTGVPLLVLDRRSEPAPGSDEPSAAESAEPASETSPDHGRRSSAKPAAKPGAAKAATEDTEKPAARQETWLLVLRALPQDAATVPATAAFPATVSPVGGGAPGESASGGSGSGAAPRARDLPIAGWVLARFVQLDPPPPIPDYASAEGLRVVAWVKLDSVPDAGPDGGEPKPQYMAAGTHGTDAPGCDFNAFRVFTWDAKRSRYETAYIAGDVCGHLPITVRPIAQGAEFRFPDPLEENDQRIYDFKQTVVRQVKQGGSGPTERHAARPGAHPSAREAAETQTVAHRKRAAHEGAAHEGAE